MVLRPHGARKIGSGAGVGQGTLIARLSLSLSGMKGYRIDEYYLL
jgi:hypothetical protein